MRGSLVLRLDLGAADAGPAARRAVERAAGLMRRTGGGVERLEAPGVAGVIAADPGHGPHAAFAHGRLIVVHGAPAAPLEDLARRGVRHAGVEAARDGVRAARDAFGQVPLFLRRAGATVWVSTEVRPLLAAGPLEPDHDALSDLAAGMPSTLRSGWRGVLRVPAGGVLSVAPDGSLGVARSWNPAALLETFRGTGDEAVAAVREAFAAAVERDREGGAAVLLSGGLDSAAVCVAPGARRGAGLAVHVAFPSLPATDEVAFATAAARAAWQPLEIVTGDLDPWDPAAELEAYDTAPTSLPTGIDGAAYAELRRRRTGAVLDGHDGDGLLGYSVAGAGLLLLHGRLRRLAGLGRRHGLRRLAAGLRADLTPGRATLPSPAAPWLAEEWRRRLLRRGAWHLPQRRWRAAQLASVLPPVVAGYESLEARAAAFDLDLRHPFTDPALVRLLLSMPFEIKADPERTKPLLRDALAGELPELIRRRPGKSFFNEVLERRVVAERCLEAVRAAGVRLPSVDHRRLEDALATGQPVPPGVLVHITRAHVWAATTRR